MQMDDITKKNDSMRTKNSLFDLILYVPSTIFQLNRDGSSWVEPVLTKDSSSYQRYLHLAVALSNCFTLACMGSLVTPSWSLSPVGLTIMLLK